MWRTKQNMAQLKSVPLTADSRKHIRSEISKQFDNELYDKINEQLSSTQFFLRQFSFCVLTTYYI